MFCTSVNRNNLYLLYNQINNHTTDVNIRKHHQHPKSLGKFKNKTQKTTYSRTEIVTIFTQSGKQNEFA